MSFQHLIYDKSFKSKYKYVYRFTHSNDDLKFVFLAKLRATKTGTETSKFYETEREAAIAVDKFLISKGFEPVNILVRK